jgi:hypothetical protein
MSRHPHPGQNLKPFIRFIGPSAQEFGSRLGTWLIPITSGEAQTFDADPHGVPSVYTVDASRLSDQQRLALATWISEDKQGDVLENLENVAVGKCLLSATDGRYEVVWLEEGKEFWG